MNSQEVNKMTKGLIGKIFYQKHPRFKNEYRTIRIAWNGIANKMVPQYSNFINGTPPDGMEEVNQRLLSSVITMQNNGSNYH